MPKSTRLTVNLWWDPSTRRIHLTSAERDRVDFHAYLPQGSSAEMALLGLLRADGCEVQAGPQSEDLQPVPVSD